MAETTSLDVTQDNAHLSDAQVDNFFKSGGNLEAEKPEAVKEAVDEGDSQPQKVETNEKEVEQKPVEKEKFVPYGALHEERERRKELQKQSQEDRERLRVMESRFQQLIEREQQRNQPQAPSFEEDPITALRIDQEKIKQAVYQQHQTEAQRRVNEEQYRNFQSFKQRYESSATEYEKEVPDFFDAYKHLSNSRFEELKAAGYQPNKAYELLIEDEAAIVAQSYNDGVNPAERIYRLAKLRGYKNASEKQPKQSEQKLEQLSKGLEASKTLSQAGGGRPEKSHDLEELLQMDSKDFLKNWDEYISKHK